MKLDCLFNLFIISRISLGAKSGFAAGDKIKIYKPIEKKNSKGEVITTTYKEAAEIVLSKVQDAMSMGEYKGPTQLTLP